MDNLLLVTTSKQSHMIKLEDLLKALLKNSLKISPKKCQLFRKELQYMGNTIFIQEKRVCVKLLCNRLKAIQRLKHKEDSIYIQILISTGSALYQIQNGKPKLIAYASKRLPKAAKNYSITELQMCGLAINIVSFAHLLKKVDLVL